jgi:hypothetical protein
MKVVYYLDREMAAQMFAVTNYGFQEPEPSKVRSAFLNIIDETAKDLGQREACSEVFDEYWWWYRRLVENDRDCTRQWFEYRERHGYKGKEKAT